MLATASLLCRARLFIDQHRAARRFAQHPLYAVQLVAMPDGYHLRYGPVATMVIGIVAQDDHLADTFVQKLLCDFRNR